MIQNKQSMKEMLSIRSLMGLAHSPVEAKKGRSSMTETLSMGNITGKDS